MFQLNMYLFVIVDKIRTGIADIFPSGNINYI